MRADDFPDIEVIIQAHARALTLPEAIAFPVGAALLMPGLAFSFGGLLHRAQPGLGLGILAFSLVLVLGGLRDAARLGIPFSSDAYRSFPRRTQEWTFVISGVPMGVAALATLFLPGSRWLLPGTAAAMTGSAILIFGWIRLYWPVAREAMPLLLKEVFAEETPTWFRREAQLDGEEASMLAGAGIGFLAASFVFVATFLPLSISVAITRSENLMDVLLLSEANVGNGQGYLADLREIYLSTDVGVLAPLGVVYGLVGLIYGMFLIVRFKAGQPRWKLFAIGGGLSLAYQVTWFLTNVLPIEHSGGAPGAYLGFLYVLFLHFGLWTLEPLIPNVGMSEKYKYIISGLQVLGTTWIVTRAVGSVSQLYTGVVFYSLFLVATGVFEIVLRPMRHLDELETGRTDRVAVEWDRFRRWRWLVGSLVGNLLFPLAAFAAFRWILGNL